MKQRPLPFDKIPMVHVIGRGKPLGRTGNEIRHHRVYRNTRSGDENARLSRRAEVAIRAALAHLRIHRQRGVHLAERAIRPDRQQALTRPAHTGTDIEGLGGMAHIEQLGTV
mgnify:CR=1 FL=1